MYAARSRIQEIATVNSHKAPELLSMFNRAWLDAGDHLGVLDLCLYEAEKTARQVRSKILLDKVPEILREKGISSARSPGGSEDQRTAILDSDPEYTEACDRVQQVKSLIQLVSDNRDGLEKAYSSVKKILGDGGHRSYGVSSPTVRTSVGELSFGPPVGGPRANFGVPRLPPSSGIDKSEE